MTWHLKDKRIEDFLNERSKKAFTEMLNTALKNRSFREVQFNEPLTFNVQFSIDLDEIEDLPEYNSKAWNYYPEVMPPECVMMRVEFVDGVGLKAYYCTNYEGEAYWYSATGQLLPKENQNPDRFRPWNE